MATIEEAEHFAHAYYREELKEEVVNPDIIAQQSGKDKTHTEQNTLMQIINFLVGSVVILMTMEVV